MARQITNQASLTYQYGGVTASAASNIATAILQETLSAAKTSLDAAYRSGQALTYILTLTNSGSAALTNVQAVDDLGTYTPAGGTAAVTPLTYTGPALLYVNGALSGPITPAAAENAITFTIPSIPAGATAMILYKARVNGNAQLAAGASVQNTVTATADGVAESVSAAHTVTAEDYADVNPGDQCGADGCVFARAGKYHRVDQRQSRAGCGLHLYRRRADAPGERRCGNAWRSCCKHRAGRRDRGCDRDAG